MGTSYPISHSVKLLLNSHLIGEVCKCHACVHMIMRPPSITWNNSARRGHTVLGQTAIDSDLLGEWTMHVYTGNLIISPNYFMCNYGAKSGGYSIEPVDSDMNYNYVTGSEKTDHSLQMHSL